MVDAPTTDISRYFYVASKFIDSAISSGGKWCGNGSGVSSVNKNLEKFSIRLPRTKKFHCLSVLNKVIMLKNMFLVTPTYFKSKLTY